MSEPRLSIEIDADIRQAWTLPARAYVDRNIFEACRDRIFARSWQLVADANDIRVPQQVFPAKFMEGMIDEPIVLTRDKQDQIWCMSNVCTHRGALVAETPGMAPHLRCRYHGRRWSLDGRFESMPEFEQAANFPSECDHLRRFPTTTLGPMVFAALDPICPFEDWMADVTARVGWMPLDRAVFDPSRSRDYLVQANWMLYCDNYLEGFHIPFVHAGLNAVIDYGTYATELATWSSVQYGLIPDGGEQVFDTPHGWPDHGRPVAGYYFHLFPNVMLNFYPWGISVNIVKPLAVDRTKISYRTYVWDESKLDGGAGANLDRVEREDEHVVESVQKGMQSRTYDRGRYSPTREQAVHHFHRMVAAHLRT